MKNLLFILCSSLFSQLVLTANTYPQLCPVEKCVPSNHETREMGKDLNFSVKYLDQNLGTKNDVNEKIRGGFLPLTVQSRVELDNAYTKTNGKSFKEAKSAQFGEQSKQVYDAMLLEPWELFAKYLSKSVTTQMLGRTLIEYDDIAEIFFTTSNYGVQQIVKCYERVNNKPLQSLLDQLPESIKAIIAERAKIKDGPSAIRPADRALKMCSEQDTTVVKKLFFESLTQYSVTEIKDLFENMETDCKEKWSKSDEKDKTLADFYNIIVEIAMNPHKYLAKRLYKAMEGAWTDVDTMVRIIIGRTDIDILSISREFSKLPEVVKSNKPALITHINEEVLLDGAFKYVAPYFLLENY